MGEEVGDQISTLMRALRTIEDRFTNARKKLSVTDQNVLESTKRISSDLRALSSELTELKHRMEEMKYKMVLLEKQLLQNASSQDLEILTKYVELWQPMNFVTKSEADTLIERHRKVY